MKFFIKLQFFLFVVLISGCTQQQLFDGYTKDSSGYYFHIVGIGDGNENPTKENIIVLEAVIKTLADSVCWNSQKDATNGLYVSLSNEMIEGSFRDYYLKMVEGDSVSFLINPSILFREYFNTISPDFCKNDSLIKFNVKLSQILSVAEYQALKNNAIGEDEEEDDELRELQIIDDFLQSKYKGVEADSNGIYTLSKTATNLEKVKYGKKITIGYQGAFIDGKVVDHKEQLFEYIVGTPDQLIKGLNIVIGSLKKGETTKIIVPSRLAFGEFGNSTGSIPPFTPLVYNIKIIDIK